LSGGRWFPDKKGTIQGAIISGMGASAFIFNMLDTKYINPTGLNAEGGVFPAAVLDRFPALLRSLGVTFALLSFAGAMLQTNPPSFKQPYPLLESIERRLGLRASPASAAPEKQRPTAKLAATPPSESVLSLVFSRKFLVLWLMILNSAVAGLNIASSYKTFGTKQPHLNSDAFLTMVGALSAIGGNAAGRLFWGTLSDKLGFKRCFTALTLVQGLTMYNYGRLAAYRPTFLIATIAMLFCMGGNFAMFPAQTFRMFGANGASVYSFLFTGFGFAALLGPVLSNKLLLKGGYSLVYTVLTLMSMLSLTLCRLFL